MKVLVGLDGSPGSERATQWVAEHGPALGARVSAVLVVPRTVVWELAVLQVDSASMLARRRAQLEGEWTEPLRQAGLRVTTRMLRGDPAVELCGLAAARDVDLLVIGAKSHNAAHDLLGGTAHKIANRARVPVLLVPAPASPKPTGPRRSGPKVPPLL